MYVPKSAWCAMFDECTLSQAEVHFDRLAITSDTFAKSMLNLEHIQNFWHPFLLCNNVAWLYHDECTVLCVKGAISQYSHTTGVATPLPPRGEGSLLQLCVIIGWSTGVTKITWKRDNTLRSQLTAVCFSLCMRLYCIRVSIYSIMLMWVNISK